MLSSFPIQDSSSLLGKFDWKNAPSPSSTLPRLPHVHSSSGIEYFLVLKNKILNVFINTQLIICLAIASVKRFNIPKKQRPRPKRNLYFGG